MRYSITCTCDESGDRYATGAIEIAQAETLATALVEIRSRIIHGKRGPGCFTIRGPDGDYWLDASPLCPEGVLRPCAAPPASHPTGFVVPDAAIDAAHAYATGQTVTT